MKENYRGFLGHNTISGEIHLFLGIFRLKSDKTGEIYAFLGRFRPNYLHSRILCRNFAEKKGVLWITSLEETLKSAN
jgi:hypothetical protein